MLPASLPGQVLMPGVRDTGRTYGGLSTGTRVGAITTSSYLYRWSAPRAPLRLGWADVSELGGSSDIYATGLNSDEANPQTQLVRIDLRDGSVVRRPVADAGGWLVLGADDGGWVVEQATDGLASETLYVPLDPDAEPRPIEAVERTPKAVGRAGIVHPGSDRLLLTSTDGATTTELGELGRGADGDLSVSMSGDVVAWWVGSAHELTYRRLRDGRTWSVALPVGVAYLQVAVVPGAVAVVQDQSTMWIWRPGSAFPSRPVTLAGGASVGQSGAWPASLGDGSPAFAVDAITDDTQPESWQLVDVRGRVRLVDIGVRGYSSVMSLTASPGRVLVQYPIGPYVELGDDSATYYETAVAYDVTRATPRRLFSEDLVPSAARPQTASSGLRSAVIDVAAARPGVDVRLRLRDGLTGVRTIPLRGDHVDSISMSGLYTAVAGGWRGSGRLPAVVLGRSGIVVANLPHGTTVVAQDGPITAYVRGDGQLWVRDVSGKVGPGNPYRLGEVSGCDRDCFIGLAISDGRVVVGVPGPEGGPFGMITVYRLGSSEAPVEIFAPLSSSDKIALVGDLLVVNDWESGVLLSLDLSTGSTELVPRLQVANNWLVALAGDRLVWCPVGSPTEDDCARPAVAPVPAAWLSTGSLT